MVVGKEGRNLQNYNPNPHTRLANFAFALTTPLEGCAVPLVVRNLLLLRALLDSAAVPERHGNEGCEPEECVQRIDGQEGVGVCEALGARPHGDHDEVDYGGDGDEAL